VQCSRAAAAAAIQHTTTQLENIYKVKSYMTNVEMLPHNSLLN